MILIHFTNQTNKVVASCLSDTLTKRSQHVQSITFLLHCRHIGYFLSNTKFILSHYYLYRWPELGLPGFSWLHSIIPIVQWRRGCCTAFLIPCQTSHSSPSRHLLSCQHQLSNRHLAFTLFLEKWRYIFPQSLQKNPVRSPSIFINVFRWFRQWCNLCQTGSVSFFPAFEQRAWKSPVCQRVAGTLCIKISAQVERHKIRSVSPHCIINTPLFISLPIESVHNKMLPCMKYLCNFLALHVEKAIEKLGVTHWQLVTEWHVAW